LRALPPFPTRRSSDLAALDQVELVAALRAHLDFPQPALRVEVDAQQVAVAQRPDLRGHAALVGEGIVGRHAAVVVEPGPKGGDEDRKSTRLNSSHVKI